MNQNRLQMEQEAFHPVHSRIKQEIQRYLIVNQIVGQITGLVLIEIQKKNLLRSIPPHAAGEANRITDSLIRKDLLECNFFEKKEFDNNDPEPRINVKEVWMRYGTKSVSNPKSRINTVEMPLLLATNSNLSSKFPSNSSSFTKHQFLDYAISLNLQNIQKDCEEEEYLRKKKKDEERKAKMRDVKKNIFRKGVKFTEDDTELNSVKPKQKKSYKFIYDDQGKKVFISQIDKYHPPQQIQMAFEYDKPKTSNNNNSQTNHNFDSRRRQKSIVSYQPILKSKQKLIIGQSTYQINRLDNSPFAKNFAQKPNQQSFRTKEEEQKNRNRKKRGSWNLFQETQTFLNKQFGFEEKENRNSVVPEHFKQFNFNNKQQNSDSILETQTFEQSSPSKKYKIKIFNQELLRRIITLQQQRNKSIINNVSSDHTKRGSQSSIRLRPSFSKH